MPEKPTTQKQLLAENEDLRTRLDEAEETLCAIRSGEVDAIVGLGEDSEELFTLKSADRSFRVLIEEMSEGALVLTAEGMILYANRCLAEMVRTPLEKVIGSVIHTWITPDNQPILQSLLRKGVDKVRREQLVLTAADGTLVPVSLSVCNLSINQEPDCFGLVAADLTEQKRSDAIAASEKLTQELLAASSQSRLTLLSMIEDQKRAEEHLLFKNAILATQQETLPGGLLTVDYDGSIISYNQRFVEMMAIPPEVLQSGKDEPLLQFVTHRMADPDAFLARVQYLYEHPEENSREQFSLTDGRVLDRFSATMSGPDGRNYGRLWYFLDVTEQLSLEGQLHQAQKMEAIGQLAGGVAHDFNNILQAMMGYSSMLLDRLPEQDETYEFAGEIAQGVDRAAMLTRQLLTFSRRQVLEMEDLDLNEVVNGMTKMIRRIIGENIEVRVMEGQRLGYIHADCGQMEQVLLNLCINARDAMPEGGVLTIETESVVMDGDYCATHIWASPGRYVLLSVTDTGCGMDARTQARIFEPFFTTKETDKGTGLGLATVYGIVRQHQGMTQVYSEVGLGTTFKIYLKNVESTASTVEIKAVERARGGTETILLAEDDQVLQTMAARILESAGYAVLLANDGKEVLDVFEKHTADIDLCLLDVVMPKMGGKAVYDVLRPQHPDLRFLFSSGYSADVIHTTFELKEDIELLQKPYAPDALLRKIRQMLDEPQQDNR